MCSVCRRTGIRIVNTTGLLRQHGPRNNTCRGSRTHPFPGSQQLILSQSHPSQSFQTTSQTARSDASVEVEVSTTTASTPSLTDVLDHPPRQQILKRIPKGARLAAANLLQKLISDVLLHPSSSFSWSRLLGFSTSCLVKPKRGGKSRNLTTSVVNQIRQYELCTDSDPPSHPPAPSTKSSKTCDQVIAAMASAKLEDGDVKGAVRLLCSDDKFAVPDHSTLAALSRLHPAAPADRRPIPSTVVPPLQVLPVIVRKAIQSFPNGSAAGPDGLRPQHLKDLIVGAADDNPLLVSIVDLVNLLLEGKTPLPVRGALFGATLLAIAKKQGGIRPIAVGYVWRRLAAKVACNHVKIACSSMLAPRQLGFGVPGGAEAAVRAARRFLDNMHHDQLFLKIDFRNAFNTLRRDAILEAVVKHFPELLPYATSTISSPSHLQFGEFILLSEEGAQQGDPLGPLYFCLVFKELLESLESELVLGYLDDVAVGDTAAIVLKDFILLEKTAEHLGLEVNRSKCEVVGHTDKTRKMFNSQNVSAGIKFVVGGLSRITNVSRATSQLDAGSQERRVAAADE